LNNSENEKENTLDTDFILKDYPLGIMPQDIWKKKRMQDILDAIDRYDKEGVDVPDIWIKEYKNLKFELLDK
jgi:hypothetical protein